MLSDPQNPRLHVYATNDVEAAAIVGALNHLGVTAIAVGGYTSGFQAEAPGDVQVLVSEADFDRARRILLEIQHQDSQIDWSMVDLGEPE